MRSSDHGLENAPQLDELSKPRRFAQIEVRTERASLVFVLLIIRGSEDNHRSEIAFGTLSEASQNVFARSPRQIQIENHKIGTRDFFKLQILDEAYSALTVLYQGQFTFNAMFFKRFADQYYIGLIIFDQDNAAQPGIRARLSSRVPLVR